MKCQSWVDPKKFNKKGLPTPRSLLATYALDPLSSDALQHYKEGTKAYEKLEAALNRAVRCEGRVEVSIYPDGDDPDGCDYISADLSCVQCGEMVHEIVMNSEIVTQWIQERLDSTGPAE